MPYRNRPVKRGGVLLPYETVRVGNGYASSGPVVVRQMTPEERAKYPPVRPTRAEIRAALAQGMSAADIARAYGISWARAHALVNICREQKRRDERVENGVRTNELQATPDPAPGERPEPQEQAPTPLEALEQGLPLDRARPMQPEDLTEDAARRLLAAGLTKHQLRRLYNYKNPTSFYRQLQRWGLHTPAPAGERRRRTGTASKPARRITLNEALGRRDLLCANLKCLAELLACTDVKLTADVRQELQRLKDAYGREIASIDRALAEVRIRL